MQGSLGFRESKDKTTWTVLVFRIIFKYFTRFYCFTNLLHCDVSYDTLVGGMPREFKLPISDFGANFIKETHSTIIVILSKASKVYHKF